MGSGQHAGGGMKMPTSGGGLEPGRRAGAPASTNLSPCAINNSRLEVREMPVVKDRPSSQRRGKKAGVILSRRRYERLMEDLHDLAVVAERRDEPSISYDEMKRRLRKRGLL
jgi:hypothetical protein